MNVYDVEWKTAQYKTLEVSKVKRWEEIILLERKYENVKCGYI